MDSLRHRWIGLRPGLLVGGAEEGMLEGLDLGGSMRGVSEALVLMVTKAC